VARFAFSSDRKVANLRHLQEHLTSNQTLNRAFAASHGVACHPVEIPSEVGDFQIERLTAA